jgi:hypothetical protein
MGIGVADPEGRLGGVTLAEARERAAAAMRLLREGIDPIDRRRQAELEAARRRHASRPFREVAELYVAAHEPSWRSDRPPLGDPDGMLYQVPLIGTYSGRRIRRSASYPIHGRRHLAWVLVNGIWY